jgi:hypothetical protein
MMPLNQQVPNLRPSLPLVTSLRFSEFSNPRFYGTDLSPYPSDNGQKSEHRLVVFQQLSTFAFASVYRT